MRAEARPWGTSEHKKKKFLYFFKSDLKSARIQVASEANKNWEINFPKRFRIFSTYFYEVKAAVYLHSTRRENSHVFPVYLQISYTVGKIVSYQWSMSRGKIKKEEA